MRKPVNDASWSDFAFKQHIEEKGKQLPANATQCMKDNVGPHEGQGFYLIPYEFNYTAIGLERTLLFALESKEHTLLLSENLGSAPGNPSLSTDIHLKWGTQLLTLNRTLLEPHVPISKKIP